GIRIRVGIRIGIRITRDARIRITRDTAVERRSVVGKGRDRSRRAAERNQTGASRTGASPGPAHEYLAWARLSGQCDGRRSDRIDRRAANGATIDARRIARNGPVADFRYADRIGP